MFVTSPLLSLPSCPWPLRRTLGEPKANRQGGDPDVTIPSGHRVTFDQYLAAFALGRLRSSDLPEAATQALAESYDSIELATLAGSTIRSSSPSELEEMWRRGLRDVNKTAPSRADAGRTLRDYYATLVATGAIEPRSGAAQIVRLATELDADLPSREFAGDGLGVAKLLSLYYNHDDVVLGDNRAHERIDEAIVEECRRLAARDPS